MKIDPSKLIKISVLELPDADEPGEGSYEFVTAINPDEKEYFDIFWLRKKLNKIIPKRSEFIIDHLQNFRKVYINLATGEITT